jgi:guanyl-specific ribonuclease Sa
LLAVLLVFATYFGGYGVRAFGESWLNTAPTPTPILAAAAYDSSGSASPATEVELSRGASAISAGGRSVRKSAPDHRVTHAVFVAAETGAGRVLNLPFRDPELGGQVDRVVSHFDEFGAPPSGVAQGGLKGFPEGTYANKSGALPEQDLGYYTESDIWPSGSGVKRGAERLIFGGGKVWFTPDHYDTFVQIR